MPSGVYKEHQDSTIMRVMAAIPFNHLVGGVFRCLRFLRHLDLLIDKMNQKSSAIQILKSVPRVLTSDSADVAEPT